MSTRALVLAVVIVLVVVAALSWATGIQPCSGPQRAAGQCPPRQAPGTFR